MPIEVVKKSGDSGEIPEVMPLSLAQKAFVIFALSFWLGYLVWRALITINYLHPVFSTLFYAAEVVGFLSLSRLAFTVFRLRERKVEPILSNPTVDVYITTYNEDAEILFQTIYHCLNMDYPHETYVLDDGKRPEIAALAAELGAKYLTRNDNRHAKAGNLNNAFLNTSGDIVAVFDADGVPRKDFLLRVLGHFENPEVALVQTPQTFYNFDSFQHLNDEDGSQIWNEQALFFDIIEPGMDYHELSMCCGNGSLVRRSALEEVGGFTTGSVTEDYHTTLLFHQNGFRTVYHNEPIAFCLAPSSVVPFIVQRGRWALGTVQVLRLEWWNILKSQRLSMVQKITYLTPIYYFSAFQKLLYYLAPFIFLCGNVSPFDAPDWIVYPFMANISLSIFSFKILARGRARVNANEIFFLYTFWPYMKAALLGLCPIDLPFKVTPKGRGNRIPLAFILPAYIVALLSAVAVASAAWKGFNGEISMSLAVAGIFAYFNFLIALRAIRVSQESTESDTSYPFYDYRPLLIQEIDGAHQLHKNLGIATILSEKYLRFVHVEEFPIGTQLLFTLDLPAAALDIFAEVVNCEVRIVSGQEPFFQIDVRYLEEDKKVKSELVRYFFEDATPKAMVSFEKSARSLAPHRGAELRKETRVSMLVPVFISEETIADSGATMMGLLLDLSPKGARIKSPVELPRESIVRIQIPWYNGNLRARVMRCNRESGQEHPPFEVGLQFLEEIRLTDRQITMLQVLKSEATMVVPAA